MAKQAKLDLKKIGHYSFIAGIILAVVIGIIPGLTDTLGTTNILLTFAVLGLIVGLLNVTAKETIGFLVAALVLIVSTSITFFTVGRIPVIGAALGSIWESIMAFVAFAAIVVALKTVIALAED